MLYRIKIEEQNNQDKWYIPQVRKVKLKIVKFNFLYTEWKNIIEDTTSFWIFSLVQTSYDTEQKSLDVIEGYKNYLINQKDKKVKSTTYKIV